VDAMAMLYLYLYDRDFDKARSKWDEAQRAPGR